ncbi:MAG: hypothetical protein PUP92_21290 [Rhizonema sp. PD38]|nr:hypothetical protein [Rhizonema sp. PD38]
MFSVKLLPRQGVTPREFCRIWFGLADLPSEEIWESETETGYRAGCVKTLAIVTGLKERTVRKWGTTLEFERMPECYRLTLAYALACTAKSSEAKKAA